jgi:replication initiation and membrane attachment protein DnaB
MRALIVINSAVANGEISLEVLSKMQKGMAKTLKTAIPALQYHEYRKKERRHQQSRVCPSVDKAQQSFAQTPTNGH